MSNKVLIAFGTLCALATSAISASNWRPEGSLPHATCCLAAAATPSGTIFAIGGTDVFDGVSAKVFRYRPGDDTWMPAPSLPTARASHAAATGGDGRLYAIGGSDGNSKLSSVVALKPGVGAAWVEVAPLPTPREELGAATGDDGKIYVVGGLTDHVVRTLQIYEPATNKWKPGAPLLTPRRGMGVAKGGDGRIYAIGGWTVPPLKSVEAYDPATNTWTYVAPLPSRRAYLSAATSPDGLIYAIGGCQWDVATGSCPDTTRVDVYSPQANRWWTLARTQVAHYSAAVVAGGGNRIFVIAGLDTAVVESRPSFCSVCQ